MILVVFVLRSFIAEPFRIPSGSMIPTLLVGDLILVNKFTYGIRLPIVNTKILDVGNPQRGDVMVFRYPVDPSRRLRQARDRPAGRHGRVSRRSGSRSMASRCRRSPAPDYFDPDRVAYSKQFAETLPRSDGTTITHMILIDDDRSGVITPDNFPMRDHCQYSEGNTAVTCKVPDGQYFMMGDNRDNSADSRYWGFVPDRNIVGRAFFIWMNFGNMSRIGLFH